MFISDYALSGCDLLNAQSYPNDFNFATIQVWQWLRPGGSAEERDPGVDSHPEGLAQRAQEEPVPNQRRKDHAGHHHKNDTDTSNDFYI